MTPRLLRISAAIHYHATQCGWDCTIADLANATGESMMTINNVLRAKSWMERIRPTSQAKISHIGSMSLHYLGNHMAREVAAGRIGAEE